MAERRRLADKVAFAADLPCEAMPGVTLVELAGDERVLIENHRGILVYTNTEIHIRVSFGQLQVKGSCLRLAQMTKSQLVILGKIEGIALCRGGKR